MSSVRGRADDVADAAWQRVRDLSARVERLREAERMDELSDDERLRLDRARLRLARAAERAQLADELADRLAELPPQRSLGGR